MAGFEMERMVVAAGALDGVEREWSGMRGSRVPQTVDEAEDALIGVHALWRRSPGSGRWPFAGDGPWHLIQGEVGDIKGDYSETLLDNGAGKQLQVRKVDSREPRTPLSASEVSERDRVTGWLGLVGCETERKAIWLATEALARGESRAPWTAIAAWVRWQRTPNALKLRYRRALGEIVCALNGWSMRKARVLAGQVAADA